MLPYKDTFKREQLKAGIGICMKNGQLKPIGLCINGHEVDTSTLKSSQLGISLQLQQSATLNRFRVNDH